MNARWLVVKYVPDLRRREPLNVGVILLTSDAALTRFTGQRLDGSIDGRRVRYVRSVPTYKAWVDHFRESLKGARSALERGDLRELQGPHTSESSYQVEWGGERIVGNGRTSPEDLLDHLFATLVEPLPERVPYSVLHLSETLMNRLEISEKITRDYTLQVPRRHGVVDDISFDYRYDNGAVNLLQRISLIHDDERGWESTHAAAWDFMQAQQADIAPQGRLGLVALVKTRQSDKHLGRQLGVLAELSRVIDLNDEDRATEELADALGLRKPALFP